MKITVLFFASFKERLGVSDIEIIIDEGSSLSDLCEQLAARGEQWQTLFAEAEKLIKASINHEMADLSDCLADGDEVAFFPPVTGG
ncbi:MoaD/ThiS family protein [Aliikangiella marina]|uniref:Molybdopterin synthase sulfur carrier subunit n=1 Tax=Aliikangiella marina TaxID=1712262 RepID=A0A545TI70_9GAMM|nr:MoaD/ThiS family protein [Aliikangiella marina]TQV76927.1 MoaD/ThiS family protein [Aliikangiella marina]